ncbi:MAG: hypothetical protein OEU26_04605 [Candidatus Tectomicrobia bacterium]|nr:hypothetical protein [Candidatus Tectomicrobia bacterium]
MIQHDAIINLTPFNVCIRTLTPQARHWIESHVTLGDVGTWADGILEIPLPASGDLIGAMLRTDLKVVQASGRMMMSRTEIALDPHVRRISPH